MSISLELVADNYYVATLHTSTVCFKTPFIFWKLSQKSVYFCNFWYI